MILRWSLGDLYSGWSGTCEQSRQLQPSWRAWVLLKSLLPTVLLKPGSGRFCEHQGLLDDGCCVILPQQFNLHLLPHVTELYRDISKSQALLDAVTVASGRCVANHLKKKNSCPQHISTVVRALSSSSPDVPPATESVHNGEGAVSIYSLSIILIHPGIVTHV